MSQLLVLTEPALQNAYLLAGAEVHVAENSSQAEAKLLRWVAQDLSALIAMDQKLYDGLSASVLQRVETSHLLLVTIPGAQIFDRPEYWQQLIQEMVREAIGVHITFRENQ
jgi:vacuolar-type H+-ATPase subunit F/Vma7